MIALNIDIGLAFHFIATGMNNVVKNVAVNDSSIHPQVCSKAWQPIGNYGYINPTSFSIPSTAS